MKRILVTGGSGFIGSHTCLTLLENGYEIISLDSYVNSSQKALDRVLKICRLNSLYLDRNLHIVEGDFRDQNVLETVFSDAKKNGAPIEAVIHLAGLKSVSDSLSNPISYWNVNVKGTINLLEVMYSYECTTIVFSSSATIYGDSSKPTLDENSNIQPINPYGTTKVAIEQFLNDIFNSSKLKWRIANLRYFNPIGAHQSGLIGENPLCSPNNIFPLITEVAIGNLNQLTVFGDDWPTLDGTPIRDYIHVMDLAEGHLKALEFLLEKETQVLNLNLGRGRGTSVLELIATFQKANDITIPYIISDRREGDPATLVADNSLATSLLNWEPKRSLTRMCRDGWNWKSLNPKGYLFN